MPDLESDVIGQVARLPLKPTTNNSLLPLHEAISNSLHAIHDRFGDKHSAEKGQIKVEVIREITSDSGEATVIGFIVSDNGVGLNKDNYRSFRTPFSQHKLKRGGKGIGRLGWLKVFRSINVKSQFKDGTKVEAIDFDFILRDKNQIELKPQPDIIKGHLGTTVRLTNFAEAFASRCPSDVDTIVQCIIGHFLPIFAGDKSPQITVHDHAVVDVREEFKSKIVDSSEVMIDVEIEGEKHPIIVRHMKCLKDIRPRGGSNNWLCLCANDRGVKEFGIDDQIGLKRLDDEMIYVGTVTGDFLDAHVNPQRTDFIFDAEEGRAIRRQVAASVKAYLGKYIDDALALKKNIATEMIRKNPQYLYLFAELDEFVRSLQPNSNNEELIFVEMSQNRFRRQRKFNGVKREIERAPEYSDAVAQKVEEYKQFIQEDKKGTLAEYVAKRKAVLDLLDTLRGFNDEGDGRQHLEDAVHQLICPMRVNSHELSIDDHNLWILDDRLAFFNFFASDKTIKSYVDSDSTREPDVAVLYDSCLAWRESERMTDTVILIEFKRPGLETYTDKNDPFLQLMDYVSLFKSGKTVRDRSGKVISNVSVNTAFHCYIVADLTAGLRKRLRGRFDPTPDNKGLFGYTRNPDTYSEVIPYDKLFLDAQARNAIFFEKLGLNG